MAKGAVSKEKIMAQILEMFEGAFAYDKEIRIPMVEDGSDIQIKCVLTCAKTNVEEGAENALPKATKAKVPTAIPQGDMPAFPEPVKIEASEQEKSAVSDLMASLGL